MVVSNIFYFHPYLGKIPILTNIFQRGWNHQLDNLNNVFFRGLKLEVIMNFFGPNLHFLVASFEVPYFSKIGVPLTYVYPNGIDCVL